MNIFICWSGRNSASFQAAEFLKKYLPLLHDTWVPFFSDRDIKAGTLWMDELFSALQTSGYGIVCISPEQKDSPWVLFESGALSKAVTSHRVLPLMVGVESTELAPPLSNFQHKPFSKEGLEDVLESLFAVSDFPNNVRDVVQERFRRFSEEMTDPIDRIKRKAREERKGAPPPPPERPLVKLLKEMQAQMGDLSGRVQKLADQNVAPIAPPVPPIAVTPAPSTVIITAQPGQDLTVTQTPPATAEVQLRGGVSDTDSPG
jgi:hypothetical protein